MTEGGFGTGAPGRGFAIAVLLAVLAGVVFAFWLFERVVATG